MSKKNKDHHVFHIQVSIGNLPMNKAAIYLKDVAKKMKKALKKDKIVVTGFRGDGRTEIIRLV